MRGLSLIVIIAAIVLGVMAVLGVRGILQTRPAPVAQAEKVSVGTVVVARVPLEFGTELSSEVLREAPWPNDLRPEGAFSSIEALLGNERRVALRSIAPNEPVLRDKISGYGGRAALSQIIDEGKRAVTIRVNDVSGAGGFVLPGDRVDILHTVNPSNNNSRLNNVTNILLQDVRVLAIDQIADESQEGAMVVKAATVEVTPFDAQKIALAAEVGDLSLSLRNSTAGGEGDDTATKTARFRDLSPARAVSPTPSAAPSPYGTVRITRGTSRTSQSVLRERNAPTRQQQSSAARVLSPQSSAAASGASKIIGATPDLEASRPADTDPVVLTQGE